MRWPIYHLVATSNIPVFKLGLIVRSGKLVLLQRIEDQEKNYHNRNCNKS